MKNMKDLLRKYGIFYDEEDLKDIVEVKIYDNSIPGFIQICFGLSNVGDMPFKFNSFKYSYLITDLCINIDKNTNKPIKFIAFTWSNDYEGSAFELEDKHLPLNIRKYESDNGIGLQLITSFNGSYDERDIV